MPQADILSFHPTLLILPVGFLGGYFFFVTHWVPRIMLTLKARAWLTRYALLTPGVLTPAGEGWPEIFLMFLQFGGLLFFLSGLTLVTHPEENKLHPLQWTPPGVPTLEVSGGLPVENFFLLWGTHREGFLFRPAAAQLTHLVDHLLGGFGFYSPGKQFPALGGRLRERLTREARQLSVPPAGRPA